MLIVTAILNCYDSPFIEGFKDDRSVVGNVFRAMIRSVLEVLLFNTVYGYFFAISLLVVSIDTQIFSKPTETYQYLERNSAHPLTTL